MTDAPRPATDEQVRALAATAIPLSVAILRWDDGRRRDGGEQIELEHQRRMVGLRGEGTIAVLCPVISDAVAGIAVMTVSVEDAERIMGRDPCVPGGMMTVEVHSCLGFPGDAIGTRPPDEPRAPSGPS